MITTATIRELISRPAQDMVSTFNSWEPTDSFENGSQHFIETFWATTSESRDYSEISLFKVNEVIAPVGPPGSTYYNYLHLLLILRS